MEVICICVYVQAINQGKVLILDIYYTPLKSKT